MKKNLLTVAAIFISYTMFAQQNLLADPGFENQKPGTSKFITPTGGKVNGMSGRWQLTFAKGNLEKCPEGCCKGTASIITTDKVTGNNALEVVIENQTNRNDIKLLQSISGTSVGGEYEISFWVKSSEINPVAIDLLKGTQPNSNNGAAPFTGNFTATKEWQQFKFTTSIADWTDEERTEMRVSIRLNNNKSLPVGPYPKTFWIDDVSIIKK